MRNWLAWHIKWIIPLALVLVVLGTTASTASAGRRWTGIDPVLDVNGNRINIWVEWDSGYTCSIDGPIEVTIIVPKDSRYQFRGESADRFDCDGDGRYDTKLATKTTIVVGKDRNNIVVTSRINSSEDKFLTRVLIYKNGKLTDTCPGPANHTIRCKGPRV